MTDPARTVVSLSRPGGVCVASVVGDLDLANAEQIGEQLLAAAAGTSSLIVSLERCRFCDSSGISTLIKLEGTFGDGLIVVVPAESHFHRIFAITGLNRVLRIVASQEEALSGAGDEFG